MTNLLFLFLYYQIFPEGSICGNTRVSASCLPSHSSVADGARHQEDSPDCPQTQAGGSKSTTVTTEMVTDLSKFLHFSDNHQMNLLVSRKAIVEYHTRLEKPGIKASGQQMKLSRPQMAAEFLLLEADGSEGEAELFRRMTFAVRLIFALTSSLGAERSRQPATRLVVTSRAWEKLNFLPFLLPSSQ